MTELRRATAWSCRSTSRAAPASCAARACTSQCETTQVREQGKGAALFGYTKLYGQVPGGQAEYLRVPFGNTLPIKVPDGPPDDRFVYLSDVLPTAWQAVRVRRGARRRHPGRARARADRRHGLRDRAPPRRRAGHRRRPRARAAGARARRTASTALDLAEHGEDLAEVVRGADRRPRPRRRDRRRRHGGARVAGRQARPPDRRAAARRRGREADGDAPASTG